MNKGHIKAGEAINLNNLPKSISDLDLKEDSSVALVKTSHIEVIRMVLPEGRDVPEHSVGGEVTVQCLKGEMEFNVGKKMLKLTAGDWLYLDSHQPHSLHAVTKSVLLVSILFQNGRK